MQRLEVSGAVRPVYGSLGVKRLTNMCFVSLILGVEPRELLAYQQIYNSSSK